MTDPDFNLLTALDVLLSEKSVAGAAKRLELSASAMSRTLARLRQVTGDPLLVRAGRKMVLTPHAESLQARAKNVVTEMRAVLNASPAPLSLSTLEKRFTLRTNEGFIDVFGPALVNAVAREAPGVTLEFVAKPGWTWKLAYWKIWGLRSACRRCFAIALSPHWQKTTR